MGALAPLHWLILIAVATFFAWPAGLILRKAGFSPWWAILYVIPLINLVVIWVFALTRWPVEGQTTTKSAG